VESSNFPSTAEGLLPALANPPPSHRGGLETRDDGSDLGRIVSRQMRRRVSCEFRKEIVKPRLEQYLLGFDYCVLPTG
jgi:hypothetical protein